MLKVSRLGIFLPHVTSQLHTVICTFQNFSFPLPHTSSSPLHSFPSKIQLYIYSFWPSTLQHSPECTNQCHGTFKPHSSPHCCLQPHSILFLQHPNFLFQCPLLTNSHFLPSNPFPHHMQFTHNILQYINPIIPSHKHLINLTYQAGRHLSPNVCSQFSKFP